MKPTEGSPSTLSAGLATELGANRGKLDGLKQKFGHTTLAVIAAAGGLWAAVGGANSGEASAEEAPPANETPIAVESVRSAETTLDTSGYPWYSAESFQTKEGFTYYGFRDCGYQEAFSGSCKNPAQKQRASDGVSFYVLDPFNPGMTLGNCVAYPNYFFNTKFNTPLTGLWGDAHTWNEKAEQAGYLVTMEPGVNYIAGWEANSKGAGSQGHVALVTAVHADKSTDVAEISGNLYGTRTNVKADWYIGVLNKDPPPAPRPLTVERLAGDDRFGTAIAVSKKSFTDQAAKAVVLTRADDFADSVAATPLAFKQEAPVLISPKESLNKSTEDEIVRVLPKGGVVYILGGTAALSDDVSRRLIELGYTVKRLGGANRFETAKKIAEELGSPDRVIETNGWDFTGAVCAGVPAAQNGMAVLLTDGSAQAAANTQYFEAKPTTRTAVGAAAAKADPSAKALVGGDQYANCVLVAQEFFPGGQRNGVNMGSIAVGSGTVFVDNLTGGRYAAAGGPLLLVDPNSLPPATERFIKDNWDKFNRVTIFGGNAAVSSIVENKIRTAYSAG